MDTNSKPYRFLSVFILLFLCLFNFSARAQFNISAAAHVQTYGTPSNNVLTEPVFSANGLKLFSLRLVNAVPVVSEYTLSSAYDVSSVTSDRYLAYPLNGLVSQTSLAFNSTGRKMFILGTKSGRVNVVHQYSLPSAFDISSANFVSSFSISPADGLVKSLAFNTSGSKMFVLKGASTREVIEYRLNRSFEISTAGYTRDFYIGNEVNFPRSLAFSNDGLKMFVLGENGTDIIYTYSLSSAFNISTSDYVENESFDVSDDESSPTYIFFNDDGLKLFVYGSGDGINLTEYRLTAPSIDNTVSGQTVDDNGFIFPFETITIEDPNDDAVTATLGLDYYKKGTLASGELGFSLNDVTKRYEITQRTIPEMQALLRAVRFFPTENRGVSDETITIRLVVNDGTDDSSDNGTTIISSPVAPVVEGIAISGSPSTNATTVDFDVTFSESVNGVDAGDFSIDASGVTGRITGIAGSGASYTVTVEDIVGMGTLSIDLDASGTGIEDLGGLSISGGWTFGATHDVDVGIAITITADAKGKTYGESDPALTYQVTSGSLESGDSFSGSLERTAGEDVDSYVISQGTVTAGANYNITYISADLTIGQKAITITADAKGKIYGEADPALSYQVTSGSLESDDSFSGSLARVVGEDVDSYGIKQGDVTAGDNYDITYMPADLTVGQKTITVTADAKGKTYGESDPVLSYQVTSGSLESDDSFSGSLERAAGEDVDTYVISRGDVTAGSNYNIAYVPADFTISQRAITITADVKGKTYGESDPEFTYRVTSGSLESGDSFSGSLVRDAGEEVGTYTIDLGQDGVTAGGNYLLSYIPANLTINPKAITITADAKGKAYGEPDPTLTYQLTSGTLVGGDSFSGSLARAAGEDVDTYVINQGDVTAGSNYDITYETADFTITANDVDEIAPDKPVITNISEDTGMSGSDGITSDKNILISGTAEANSSIELFTQYGSVGTTEADGNGDWTYDLTGTTLVELTFNTTAKATDAAGNTSEASNVFTIKADFTAPAKPVITHISDDTGVSSSDGITSDKHILIMGTAETNSSVELFTQYGNVGTTQADGNGDWTYDLTGTTLLELTFNTTAKATDLAGNTSETSNVFTIKGDFTAPAKPVITHISDDTGVSSSDGITSDKNILIMGTAEANSSIELFTQYGSVGTTQTDGNGDWTYDLTGATLVELTFNTTAKATDAAGNTSEASNVFTIKADFTAPAKPVITHISDDTGVSNSDGITSDKHILIMGTAETNSSVELFTQYGSVGTTQADENGDWTYDLTGTTLVELTFNTTAKATDAAGNTSEASNVFTIKADFTAPNVTLKPSGTTRNGNLTVTVHFHEDVIGFSLSDITAAAGSVSNLVGVDGKTYTFEVTNANTNVSIAANLVEDIAGNGNLDSNNLSLDFTLPSSASNLNITPSEVENSSTEFVNGDQIMLYPNPATNVLNIDMSVFQGQPADVRIYSASGVGQYDKEGLTDSSLRIDVSNYSQGIFVILIKSENSFIRKKFVIQR